MAGQRCFLIVLVAAWSAVGSRSARAVDVEKITTDVGLYEIVVVAMPPAPFDLTESREAGVRAVSSGQQVTLEGFRTANANQAVGQISIPPGFDWCVIGDQLFVGFRAELRIFSIPELKEIRRRSLGEPPPADLRSGVQPTEDQVPAVRRFPNGWYYDGSVFDNTGEKLRCLLYPRMTMIRRTERPIIPEQTAALERWPLTVGVQSGVIALTGFPPTQNVVDPIRSKMLGDVGSVNIAGLRIHNDVCTFLLRKTAVHLRVVKFDATRAGLPLSKRLAYEQPTFLLSNLAVDAPHQFQDGPARPVIVHFGDFSLGGPDPTDLGLEARANRVIDISMEDNRIFSGDFAKTKEAIQKYKDQTAGEFQRATGKSPQGIPVPIRVVARSTWIKPGTLHAPHYYWVWADVPEEPILASRFQSHYAAERSAKREAAVKARTAAVSFQATISRGAQCVLLIVAGIVAAVLIALSNRANPPPVPVKVVKTRQQKRPPRPPLEPLES